MAAPTQPSVWTLTLRGLSHEDKKKKDATTWAIARLVATLALSTLMIGIAACFAYTTRTTLKQGVEGLFRSSKGRFYEQRTFNQVDALENYFKALLVAGFGLKITHDACYLYPIEIRNIVS
jgi:hypothetical protein